MVTDVVSCPLTQRQLIDEFFMEHRTKVLDIAAFLDRFERAAVRDAEDDFPVRRLPRDPARAHVGPPLAVWSGRR